MTIYYKLGHLVEKPTREYVPACEPRAAERTIDAAKKKGPLDGGPVSRVRVAPFNLQHPLHPRFAQRVPSQR